MDLQKVAGDTVDGIVASLRFLKSYVSGSLTLVFRPSMFVQRFTSNSENRHVNTKDSDGYTALTWAASYGHADVVGTLLAAKADVNTDSIRGTALIAALEHSDADMVRELFAAKADVNADSIRGMTPLIMASFTGDADQVRALLAAGADVNRQPTRGCGPGGTDSSDEGRLPGAEYDLKTGLGRGCTALIVASVLGHTDVVRALLAAGADVNAKGKGQYRTTTALKLTSEEGHSDVVEILKNAGARY